MSTFADTLASVVRMKSDGVVEDYAIAGAIAVVFWSEPIPTMDLDVLVILPPADATPLVTREPSCQWARQRGYPERGEHVEIYGVPVQFIPSPNPLADEAIRTAALLDYDGVPVRVVRPEYLIALYLDPGGRTRKRLERAAALMELPSLDRALVVDILKRHDLSF